jgi:hypothetical protein
MINTRAAAEAQNPKEPKIRFITVSQTRGRLDHLASRLGARALARATQDGEVLSSSRQQKHRIQSIGSSKSIGY